MKGTVLDYSVQQSEGVIAGDDGHHYAFSANQWCSKVLPEKGRRVDFDVEAARACDIYALDTVMSRRLTAAILAFFLGGIGMHKFYLGRKKAAIIMLCIWLSGLVLLALPSVIVVIIGVIEAIIYLSHNDADFEQRYIVEQKAWF